MEAPYLERRRHRVYVTRYTEYHLRDGICVGVRGRGGAPWLRGHAAHGKRADGVCLSSDGMEIRAGEPSIGDGLCFAGDDRRIVTGRVESILRPSKSVVADYR